VFLYRMIFHYSLPNFNTWLSAHIYDSKIIHERGHSRAFSCVTNVQCDMLSASRPVPTVHQEYSIEGLCYLISFQLKRPLGCDV
jgi:hypothetical protein